MTEIAVANMTLGNHQPMSLIGGMNVIESRDLVMRVAEAFVQVTSELGLPYILKPLLIRPIAPPFMLSADLGSMRVSRCCKRSNKHSVCLF